MVKGAHSKKPKFLINALDKLKNIGIEPAAKKFMVHAPKQYSGVLKCQQEVETARENLVVAVNLAKARPDYNSRKPPEEISKLKNVLATVMAKYYDALAKAAIAEGKTRLSARFIKLKDHFNKAQK